MKNPIRLLHLEDSPLDAELIREKLEMEGLGCDIVWVADRKSFESALERQSFDIVLSDFSVPGYNGKAALSASLAAQPQTPVILISGMLGDLEAVECLKAGATDHVLKDHLERLVPAIERALRESKEHQERIAAEQALRKNEKKLRLLNAELEHRIAKRTQQLAEAKMAAEAANRAKSRFLAMMSHEIRTPMNAVVGLAELLEESVQDGEHKEMLGTLRIASESLLNIINDILDFSKIEAGRLEIVQEPSSLVSILESVRSLFLPRAREKGLKLNLESEHHLSAPVLVDAVRVRQILMNLTSNAIKFTDGGSVTLRAETIDVTNDSIKTRLQVIDTGAGMSAQDLQNLFQPFTQFDAGHDQRANGTGLGLAISQKLAELMGGTLTIESRLGVGTTATLLLELPRVDSLPSQRCDATPHDANTKFDAPAKVADEMPWILVVDDSQLNREVLIRQINNLGYPADSAASGGEALGFLQHRHYGLIVLDCQMPGMDGYQLAVEVRRREAAGGKAPTPIIACTANTQADDIQRCYKAGMNDHLFKPVTLEKLRKKLENWIRGPTTSTATTEFSAETKHASPQASEDSTVIDRSILLDITGNDEELALEFLRDFREQQDNLFLPVKQALDDIDSAAIKAAAHRLKGAARTIGAVALSLVCERMELAAQEDDSARFSDIRQVFYRETQRLTHYLARVN